MKASKLVMILFTFLLIFGCLTPLALAKPKTNYIKAIGKGTVTSETTNIPARVLIEAFVTPGGYTTEYSIYEGTADVIFKFVLLDGTKTTTTKQIPILLIITDDGFTIAFDGQATYVVATTVIKNKIYGTLTAESITINPELTVDLNFVLRFQIEIEGLTAGV